MFTAHSKNAMQQLFAALSQTEYVRKQDKILNG